MNGSACGSTDGSAQDSAHGSAAAGVASTLPCAALPALVVLVVYRCRMVGSGIGSDWIGGE